MFTDACWHKELVGIAITILICPNSAEALEQIRLLFRVLLTVREGQWVH